MNLKHRLAFSAFIFISFLWQSYFFAECVFATDDVDMWDPSKIETLVRLKVTDNDPGGGCCFGDYSGLALMIETRKKGLNTYEYIDRSEDRSDANQKQQFPKNVLWYAHVVFSPYTKDDACDPDPTGAIGVYKSQVSIKYLRHPNYFSKKKEYGTNSDTLENTPESAKDNDSFKVLRSSEPQTYYNKNEGKNEEVLLHNSWINGSFFEWTLSQPISINDLLDKVRRNFTSKYSKSGFTDRFWNGEVDNCVSFSVRLLKDFGFLKDYHFYSDYKANLPSEAYLPTTNPESKIKRGFRVLGKLAVIGGCTVVSGGVCALAGSYICPGPGTVAGGEAGAKAGATFGASVITYLSSLSTAARVVTGVGAVAGFGGSTETTRIVSYTIDPNTTVKGIFHYDRYDDKKELRVVKVKTSKVPSGKTRFPRNLDSSLKDEIENYDKNAVYGLVTFRGCIQNATKRSSRLL